MAKGFHQQAGVDYGDTFSPVIKITIVRLVLAIDVSFGWTCKQLDVQNAFLHGELQEVVYMEQPSTFVHPDCPQHVCQLRKALYSLKQAPQAWFSQLSSHLLELGFTTSKVDTSLFIYVDGPHLVYLVVYVDDYIIASSSLSLV